MKNAPPSVEKLIRKHSKARVLFATKVPFLEQATGRVRELADRDVVDSLVRKYA